MIQGTPPVPDPPGIEADPGGSRRIAADPPFPSALYPVPQRSRRSPEASPPGIGGVGTLRTPPRSQGKSLGIRPNRALRSSFPPPQHGTPPDHSPGGPPKFTPHLWGPSGVLNLPPPQNTALGSPKVSLPNWGGGVPPALTPLRDPPKVLIPLRSRLRHLREPPDPLRDPSPKVPTPLRRPCPGLGPPGTPLGIPQILPIPSGTSQMPPGTPRISLSRALTPHEPPQGHPRPPCPLWDPSKDLPQTRIPSETPQTPLDPS